MTYYSQEDPTNIKSSPTIPHQAQRPVQFGKNQTFAFKPEIRHSRTIAPTIINMRITIGNASLTFSGTAEGWHSMQPHLVSALSGLASCELQFPSH